jgi:alpha-galactosidase
MSIKISLIGAGSGAFSLAMIRDICLTQNLAGSRVCLMDINPQRLDAAFSICKRYAEELNFPIQLEKTLDRREALDGADFIINTALAAGHHRLRAGWEIARKHGYDWGGSFHVMYDEAFWINFYQFRLFDSIIEDQLSLCPEAYHLLVANPVLAGITHIGRKYPQARVVGLCHGFSGIYGIANLLGLDRSQMSFEIPGVNHFVWLNHWTYQGKDAFPILDRWIETEAPRYWKEHENYALEPKLADLYKRFGALPIGDSAHWSGAAWPWFYHSSPDVEAAWQEHPVDGWNGYFDYVTKAAEDTQRVANDPQSRVTDWLKPVRSSEVMIPIIESIACDIPRVLIGNILNTGNFVPGVPTDFEVEIPVYFNAGGMQGIQTRPLPKPVIAYILRERVAPVELELAAYNQCSKDLLRQLILADPWSRSVSQVDKFLEEILAMPDHAEMRQYYR